MNEIRIAVLQRGWVVVGYFERDGFFERLGKGAVLRRWGTSGDAKGLGYLAKRGPTSETTLEPIDLGVEWHTLVGVQTFICDRDVWAPVLDALEMPT